MMSAQNSLHIVCPSCGAVNRVLSEKAADRPRCGTCKSQLFPGGPVVLDERTFEKQITRNDIPVVVDFWAAWCAPCRMMAPAFEQAAAELEPGVRLAKLDTEQAQTIAARFNIRSIPTLVVFRNGREIARQSGAMQYPQLMQWVRAHTA
jgi:thioredoxin 2